MSLVPSDRDAAPSSECTGTSSRIIRPIRLRNQTLTSDMKAKLLKAREHQNRLQNRLQSQKDARELCTHLYELAYEKHMQLQIRADSRAWDKACFQRDALFLRCREPFIRRGPIKITLRNALTGEDRWIIMDADSRYSDLYRAARIAWNQPTHATSISMKLWANGDPSATITARSETLVGRRMNGKTLHVHFYTS